MNLCIVRSGQKGQMAVPFGLVLRHVAAELSNEGAVTPRPPRAAANSAVSHEQRARGWPATWPHSSPTPPCAQSRSPSLSRGRALAVDALAILVAGGTPRGPTWRPRS